ncbi:MAG: rubredoxin [Candidatus Thioglobus sp.]|nr:rubredoxin [Candidatus Thioglobus sp.]
MKKYRCLVCDWIYDEYLGAPLDGIAPQTKWEDVPADWVCPDCGATKDEFEMIEI